MINVIVLLFILKFRFVKSYELELQFNYTGAVQYFTVPPDVYLLNVTAAGGPGATCCGGLVSGGKVTCSFPVVPNQLMYVYVGGEGFTPGCNSGTLVGCVQNIPGGFNGGKHS